MRRRGLISILGIVLTLSSVSAQVPKFGKVSAGELEMTAYEKAPGVDAIILFDFAELRITDNFTLEMKRTKRLKILTEEGKREADVKIVYWHEDKIRGIKAHTILPDGKKIKLDKKDIYEEHEKYWKYKVFAIPGVEVGSIIEFQYELSSEYLHYLEPWSFQNRVYTRLSRISVIIPPGFSYNVYFQNVASFEPVVETLLGPGKKLVQYTWEMEDLPPIRDSEPFMRAWKDYLATMGFQLKSFQSPFHQYNFIQSWPDLIKQQGEYYQSYLKENKFLKQTIREILPQKASDIEKVKILYDFVRDSIETSSSDYWTIEKEPEKLFKEGRGTGSEKNILLVNLLQRLGLDAHPLMISTRSNGKIWKDHPYLLQFNYVLAYVNLGTNTYILDTRNRSCPHTLLPVDDLVEIGLLIDENEGKFVPIPEPRLISVHFSKTDAQLTAEGTLIAGTLCRYEGYRSMYVREALQRSGEKEFVENMLHKCFGKVVLVDSLRMDGLSQVGEPLVIEVSYRIPEFAQVVGEMMYLNAPLIEKFEENPFKSQERHFPIEFPYLRSDTDYITLTIPEHFKVVELPGQFMRRQSNLLFGNECRIKGNQLLLKRQYIQGKLRYEVREYTALREFYDAIVKADQGQIVMTRAEAGLPEPLLSEGE